MLLFLKQFKANTNKQTWVIKIKKKIKYLYFDGFSDSMYDLVTI